jgi:hypothetical protein
LIDDQPTCPIAEGDGPWLVSPALYRTARRRNRGRTGHRTRCDRRSGRRTGRRRHVPIEPELRLVGGGDDRHRPRRTFVYDGDRPFALNCIDDALQIIAAEDDGPRALVETDSEVVVGWAKAKYERCKREATELSLS